MQFDLAQARGVERSNAAESNFIEPQGAAESQRRKDQGRPKGEGETPGRRRESLGCSAAAQGGRPTGAPGGSSKARLRPTGDAPCHGWRGPVTPQIGKSGISLKFFRCFWEPRYR